MATPASNARSTVAAWLRSPGAPIWEQSQPPSLSYGTSVATEPSPPEPYTPYEHILGPIHEMMDNPMLRVQRDAYEGVVPSVKSHVETSELLPPRSVLRESIVIADGFHDGQQSSRQDQAPPLEQTAEGEDDESDSDSELRAFFGFQQQPVEDTKEETARHIAHDTFEEKIERPKGDTDHEELVPETRDFDEDRILNPIAYFASLNELENDVLEHSWLKLYLVKGSHIRTLKVSQLM